MVSETQFVEERLKGCKGVREIDNDVSYYCGELDSKKKLNWCDECEIKFQTHLTSLKRELEFLEGGEIRRQFHLLNCLDKPCVLYRNRIADIKQAIKLYEEAGIK